MHVTKSEPDTGTRLRPLLALLCTALVLGVAGNSAQAIALPEVAGDLGADQTELTWVVDAYALTSAALLPPAGIAADRVGRRTLLVGGLVVFGAAGMVSAYAADPRPVVDGPAERRRQQESVGFGQLVERPVQD